ncbi:MAG TPA: hypothetical protein VKZ96_09145, partial [Thermomicrobiales bacterium]|nr:hypothetical protein [Thermomicrobiales bacterium]
MNFHLPGAVLVGTAGIDKARSRELFVEGLDFSSPLIIMLPAGIVQKQECWLPAGWVLPGRGRSVRRWMNRFVVIAIV